MTKPSFSRRFISPWATLLSTPSRWASWCGRSRLNSVHAASALLHRQVAWGMVYIYIHSLTTVYSLNQLVHAATAFLHRQVAWGIVYIYIHSLTTAYSLNWLVHAATALLHRQVAWGMVYIYTLFNHCLQFAPIGACCYCSPPQTGALRNKLLYTLFNHGLQFEATGAHY